MKISTPLQRYCLALAVVALLFLLRTIPGLPVATGSGSLLLFAAAAICGRAGGIGPGLLVSFFFPLIGSLRGSEASLGIGPLLLGGILATLLGARWGSARRSEEALKIKKLKLEKKLVDQNHVEEELNAALSLTHSALESTTDGLLMVNREGKMTGHNKKFVEMWRIPSEIVASRDDNQALAYVLEQLKEPERFLAQVRALYAEPDTESFDLLEFKDGRLFERYSKPQKIENVGVGRVWTFRDVTESRRNEQALQEQAIRDSLTGLYNRRYFDQRTEDEIVRADRENQPLAILMCDLDSFKVLNDTLGHQVGDRVLKAVAMSILDSTRGIDLIFRWGGDEIVVLLSKTTREGVLTAATRIREGILKIGKELDIPLDLSIGAALYPEHGRTIDALINMADRSLYIAKKGGDKIHIGDMEYVLDEAAVQIVFQPVVSLPSRDIIGYEALSRDPSLRLSIQDLFKKYQAIGQLSELKRICFLAQLKEAQALQLKRVFINVDFHLLDQLPLLSKPPDLDVILEISESEALLGIDRYLEIARRWRGEGFRFAIDDFGAGFVSFPFISQLVPEYIKIDRSALLQAVASTPFRKFMKELVGTLRNFEASGIIAEGIETEEELQVVREMEISLAQGFLLGKPEKLHQTRHSSSFHQ
ncbi:MAG: diguanylate cyclase [Nitrospirae bacterium]|nr:diguanylate cyclase [Candidatus Manganitrophaceae bacterium]